MGNLTPAEKAALYLHVLEDVNDWKELYKIAVGEYKFNLLADNTKNKYVTTWKNSPRIKKGVDEIKIYFHAKTQEIKQNAILEAQQVETKPTQGEQPKPAAPAQNAVNFLNPDEFLQFANCQANEIQDEKERREYLKMIANLMNYKESDSAEIEIQRFYTPILCETCEIYNKCKGCALLECPNVSK